MYAMAVEAGDSCFGSRLFLGWIVRIVFALVGDARKQLGGDAGAAVPRAELRILDCGAKRVFCGGHAIGAGFA
jgi:hypothetical protein